MSFATTPSQTVGPFFRIGLEWRDGPFVVAAGTPGGLWIRGRVLDGAGDGVPDALVETWQADAAGSLGAGPISEGRSWSGFGRCGTDAEGAFAIFTIKPGSVGLAADRREAGSRGLPRHAPHVAVSIFARGLLHRLATRIYFPEDAALHAEDPALASLDPSRRGTLIAAAAEDGYRFDVRLQGEHETVFFAV